LSILQIIVDFYQIILFFFDTNRRSSPAANQTLPYKAYQAYLDTVDPVYQVENAEKLQV